MKIAVTGASGHLGNVVCRKLIEKGFPVKAFYQSDSRALQGLNVELVQGSVLNKHDLHRLVHECDVVINCAAIISIHGDKDGTVLKTNTQGPKNLWEVALEKGVKKFIHVSSVHAVTELPHAHPYDETRPYKTSSDYAYDYSKALAEQLLLKEANNSSLKLIIVRPSCIVGPFDFKPSKMGTALMDFYNQKIPILPHGGYDIVDVRDVTESILKTIETDATGEIYLLAGKYYSLKELAQTIKHITGKRVPQKVMPYWLLRSFMPFVSTYEKITKTNTSFTVESISALKNGHPNMNHSKAAEKLNHSCRPLEETLHDFYEWQKRNNNL